MHSHMQFTQSDECLNLSCEKVTAEAWKWRDNRKDDGSSGSRCSTCGYVWVDHGSFTVFWNYMKCVFFNFFMSLDLKVHRTQILFNPFRVKCSYGSFKEAWIVSNGMKKKNMTHLIERLVTSWVYFEQNTVQFYTVITFTVIL